MPNRDKRSRRIGASDPSRSKRSLVRDLARAISGSRLPFVRATLTMREYKHTQVGYIHVILNGASVLFLGGMIIVSGFELRYFILLIVMVILMTQFSALTVRVGGRCDYGSIRGGTD